jgi:VIT1/CCC1 family predicted Fe2+/Mn2+ transporter
MNLLRSFRTSLHASIGDIVFGMEDGTVSIFGLVFGVALSSPDSSAALLAGATGAAAAAVSMMAGSYLDAESQRDLARARTPAMAAKQDAAALGRIGERLRAAGIPAAQADALRTAFDAIPGSVAACRAEFEPDSQSADASPLAHALWMFVSDLFAGAVPVLPFAFLPLAEARIVSLIVTTVLLVALGIGRGLVAGRAVLRTTLETLFVAAAAAGAGVLIGRMLS